MQDALSLIVLNRLIRDTLDTQLEPSYWVIAEIGELKVGHNGHAYLELLEKQGNQTLAKIRANIWSYSYRGISSKFEQATGQRLQASMKILALVSVTFHEIYGISLHIKDVDPNFTLGERAKNRQVTIDRLQREGLIDKNKQLILPSVPQRIAVISSPNAAGYEDFINQLENNPYGYQIHTTLFPALMQGAEAATSIRTALQKAILGKKFQAIVVVRGGGSSLDLECFDEYELARDLAVCPIPVLTGIGHERDESVADLVAHTKLKTPTAVAAFLLDGFLAFEEHIVMLHKRMERSTMMQTQNNFKLIQQLGLYVKSLARQELKQEEKSIDQLHYQIKSWSLQELKIQQLKVHEQSSLLSKTWGQLIEREQKSLTQLQRDIIRLDPEEHFKRGYTRSEINGVPLHTTQPRAGDQLTTYGIKQKIESIIKSTTDYGNSKS
ncbi:exodeoxyribonuclease VII large subunit [Mongoliitalea daihaiensis]|uniref:exodeoxyribonuclease VII large subunit n=1 Tax=Mongoliitalea daihaiensis TaxID=2782006 RepID=UPI001F35C890|nr:exodeoxyribonuclease VII large subunit [Mongoliitalea daihaiensis]UJP63505.1 exodeoxyribonuclease VII large subunit [Mongoliitalea daihaiensis]